MSGDYLERQTEPAQKGASPAGEPFSDDGAHTDTSAGGRGLFRAATRIFCGFWIALLLAIWPSSDWIGLLVLSQALFAAAYLLKGSSAGSGVGSAERRPMGLAQGEDHAH